MGVVGLLCGDCCCGLISSSNVVMGDGDEVVTGNGCATFAFSATPTMSWHVHGLLLVCTRWA